MASLRLMNRADRSHTPSKFNESDISQDDGVFELIVPTRVNGLGNAANRVRPPGQDPFVFVNNDDSIIGETITEDLVDGVDLRAKRMDMSFSLLDAASLMFSMTSFFLDLVFDLAVACFHYANGDYWFCGLTLAFIILPSMTTTAISWRWYIIDSQIEGAEPITKVQWITRFIFHLFQVGPVLRYYESLEYGMKFRETKDPSEKKKIYMKMIYEDADATMLRLFESFMESAPQLMLQVYIIRRNYPFTGYEYWTAILQTISITSSLISISWSLVAYSKSLRISLSNKIPMTYSSMAVMFWWEFFSTTARMIALALFTSEFTRSAGFVALAHWMVMFLWIYSMKTNFCNTKLEEIGFNAILGVVFIFCYFNPVDTPTRLRYLVFYAFMFLENSLLMALWYNEFPITDPKWLKDLPVYTHYTCFFLGLLTMLIYYRFFHPTGGIRIRRSQSAQNESRISKHIQTNSLHGMIV